MDPFLAATAASPQKSTPGRVRLWGATLPGISIAKSPPVPTHPVSFADDTATAEVSLLSQSQTSEVVASQTSDADLGASQLSVADASQGSTSAGAAATAAAVTAGPPLPAGAIPLVLPGPAVAKGGICAQIHGASMDVSGDTGAVGRMNVTENSVLLDLQGHRYLGRVYPSATLMVVNVGPTDAKIVRVMNEIVHFRHLQDVVGSINAVFHEGERDEALFGFKDVGATTSKAGAEGGDDRDTGRGKGKGTKGKERKRKSTKRPRAPATGPQGKKPRSDKAK